MMRPIPLDKLRLFSWQSQKSALWWLGLLYRKPKLYQKRLRKLDGGLKQMRSRALLFLHALPYQLLMIIILRFFVSEVLHISLREELLSSQSTLFVYLLERIVFGIAIGIAVGITFDIAFNIAFGIVGGVAFGITVGIIEGAAFGITIGITVGIAFGVAVGIAVGIATLLFLLRGYYHPLFFLLSWPRPRAKLYRFHPVNLDDLISLPFPRFDRLLVALADAQPQKGAREIERLIAHYPAQRKSALRAKSILTAQKAGACDRLTELPAIVAPLPEGGKKFLAQSPQIKSMVAEIARLQQQFEVMTRPVFRQPLGQALVKEIENFGHRIAGFHDPLAEEFGKAARNWQRIAEKQLAHVLQAVTQKEATPQVFRAGDPVAVEREAFVPRYSVIGDLEKQIMSEVGCPGLVIYARRRMGKSSLLRSVQGFLPRDVRVASLSMQNPQMFTSLEHWTQAVANLVQTAAQPRSYSPFEGGQGDVNKRPQTQKPPTNVPSLFSKEILSVKRTFGVQSTSGDIPLTPFEGGISGASRLDFFYELLSEMNEKLAEQDRRLMLGIDEYENIDAKIGEGVFPEDLLATIRESIQSHRQITWVFAGSHEIEELPHAPWTSYLVSARTIEMPPFSEPETRILLTEPLRHSRFWEKDDPKRPRFTPEFWGEGGIERIHREAGGWPHLVQLIAETIVDFINDEMKRHVDDALMERALEKAIVSGHNVLYELVRRECTLPGEWKYLSAFRAKEMQSPPQDEAVHRSLRRRLLVEEINGDWRMRVPLMARWLKKRG